MTEQVLEDVDQPVADEVVDALLRVGKDDPDGLIQPEAVVDAASDPGSPLHRYFTWDDTEAARQYRLTQARHLVARVKVVRGNAAPRFVNVVVKHGDGRGRRGYVETERAVVEPDLYQQVVQDARRGLIAYRNRLAAFEQARDLIPAFDALIAKTKGEETPNHA